MKTLKRIKDIFGNEIFYRLELINAKMRQIIDTKIQARAIYNNKRLPIPSDFKEFLFLFPTLKEAEKEGIDVMRQTTAEYYNVFREKHKLAFSSF